MITDIIICVLIIVFMLVGILRGFCRSIVSFVGWILTIVLTFTLAGTLANALFDTGLGKTIYNPLLTSFSEVDAMNIPIPNDLEQIKTSLAASGLPSFLTAPIADAIFAILPTNSLGGKTIAEALATSLSSAILIAISAIILFIALRIVFIIIEHIVGKSVQFSIFNGTDRLLGGVLGFAKGFLIVFVLFAFITPLSSMGFLSFARKDIDESSMGKWFEQNNFMARAIYSLDWKDILSKNFAHDTEEPSPTKMELAYTKQVFTSENNESFILSFCSAPFLLRS